MELHVKLGIPKERGLYQCGKNDLFAVVIAFRYLLSKQEFLEFKRVLTGGNENYHKECIDALNKKYSDYLKAIDEDVFINVDENKIYKAFK